MSSSPDTRSGKDICHPLSPSQGPLSPNKWLPLSPSPSPTSPSLALPAPNEWVSLSPSPSPPSPNEWLPLSPSPPSSPSSPAQYSKSQTSSVQLEPNYSNPSAELPGVDDFGEFQPESGNVSAPSSTTEDKMDTDSIPGSFRPSPESEIEVEECGSSDTQTVLV